MFARRGDLSAAWTVLRQGDQAIYRTCAEFSLIREDALVGKIEAERDAARAQVGDGDVIIKALSASRDEWVKRCGEAQGQVAALTSAIVGIQSPSSDGAVSQCWPALCPVCQGTLRMAVDNAAALAASHEAEVARAARAEVLERLAQEWGNDAGAQVVRRFAMRMAAAESTPPTTGGKA